MDNVVVDLTMSLDGFVAGPNPTLEEPLGQEGERLHEWIFDTLSWRERHGHSGGEASTDSEIVAEATAATGAVVMGRKMFSGGSGAWESDPRASGWWGDDPPFHVPVFVLTHHVREPLPMEGGTTFTFVTDGIGAALDQAREAAGERDVQISGGANVVQQALDAGLVDEVRLHIAPLLLGSGTRLFAEGADPRDLEVTRVVSSPKVTHVTFRVL